MFKIDVHLTVSPTAIVTERTVQTYIISLLSAILGSISGILDISILFLVKLERITGKVKEKLEKRKTIKELMERRNNLRLCGMNDEEIADFTTITCNLANKTNDLFTKRKQHE